MGLFHPCSCQVYCPRSSTQWPLGVTEGYVTAHRLQNLPKPCFQGLSFRCIKLARGWDKLPLTPLCEDHPDPGPPSSSPSTLLAKHMSSKGSQAALASARGTCQPGRLVTIRATDGTMWQKCPFSTRDPDMGMHVCVCACVNMYVCAYVRVCVCACV